MYSIFIPDDIGAPVSFVNMVKFISAGVIFDRFAADEKNAQASSIVIGKNCSLFMLYVFMRFRFS